MGVNDSEKSTNSESKINSPQEKENDKSSKVEVVSDDEFENDKQVNSDDEPGFFDKIGDFFMGDSDDNGHDDKVTDDESSEQSVVSKTDDDFDFWTWIKSIVFSKISLGVLIILVIIFLWKI